MDTWLDVAVVRCPNCGNYHVDASWYIIELESDIQCGRCQTEFNGKENATDRVLLEFTLNENGKMRDVKIAEHLPLE
jgi:NMD protein affecting ribosome stability and mRNA decay